MQQFNITKQGMATQASKIAKDLKCGDVILLYGNLGVGKTFMTNKICAYLDVKNIVNSPSYVLLNEYEGRFKIFHYDLYRLSSPEEAMELGIIDSLHEGITFIEWPELIQDYLPKNRIEIYLEHNDKNRNMRIVNTTIPSK